MYKLETQTDGPTSHTAHNPISAALIRVFFVKGQSPNQCLALLYHFQTFGFGGEIEKHFTLPAPIKHQFELS